MKTNKKHLTLESLKKSSMENLHQHKINLDSQFFIRGKGVETDTWDANGMVHCDHILTGTKSYFDIQVDPFA